MKTQIVVIGAGYAGMIAALRLAGKDHGRRADITLINGTDSFVERIRQHQVAANQAIKPHRIRKLLGERPIRFVTGWVESLDLEQKAVRVDVQGETQAIRYDYLAYALGSVVAKSGVPGVKDYTYGMGNPAEASALRSRLAESMPDTRVVVVGGGLTGIESTTEIAEAYPHLHVTMVTGGTPGAGLSQSGQAYLAKTLHHLHVDVRDHVHIKAVESQGLITDSGERIPFDLCVWAGSFVASPLAREAGLKVNARGQIVTDSFLRSVSHPEVFAAGDSAAHVSDAGVTIRMACATAMPMGAHVADNLLAQLAGRPMQPFEFAYALQCISLGRQRGLVQFVHADDSPGGRVLTGRTGAFVKEAICQFAFRSIGWERTAPGLYWWPKKGTPDHAVGSVTRSAVDSVRQ